MNTTRTIAAPMPSRRSMMRQPGGLGAPSSGPPTGRGVRGGGAAPRRRGPPRRRWMGVGSRSAAPGSSSPEASGRVSSWSSSGPSWPPGSSPPPRVAVITGSRLLGILVRGAAFGLGPPALQLPHELVEEVAHTWSLGAPRIGGVGRPPGCARSGPVERLHRAPEPGEDLVRELVRAQRGRERRLPLEARPDRERRPPRPRVVLGRDERHQPDREPAVDLADQPRQRAGERRSRGAAAAVPAAARTPGRPRGSSRSRRRPRPTARRATSRRGRRPAGPCRRGGGGRRCAPPARAGTRDRDAGVVRARGGGYRAAPGGPSGRGGRLLGGLGLGPGGRGIGRLPGSGLRRRGLGSGLGGGLGAASAASGAASAGSGATPADCESADSSTPSSESGMPRCRSSSDLIATVSAARSARSASSWRRSISRRTSSGGGASDSGLAGPPVSGTMSPVMNDRIRLRGRATSDRARRIASVSSVVTPLISPSAPLAASAAPQLGHCSTAASGRGAEHHGHRAAGPLIASAMCAFWTTAPRCQVPRSAYAAAIPTRWSRAACC